jgi:hypothetical protein
MSIGLAHGREVHGQPKKIGEPLLEIRGDLMVGIVRRNGIDVLTGTIAGETTARQSRQPDTTFRLRPQHQSESALTIRPPFIGCRSSICSTVFTGGRTSLLCPGALFTTISLRGPERVSRTLVAAQGRDQSGAESPCVSISSRLWRQQRVGRLQSIRDGYSRVLFAVSLSDVGCRSRDRLDRPRPAIRQLTERRLACTNAGAGRAPSNCARCVRLRRSVDGKAFDLPLPADCPVDIRSCGLPLDLAISGRWRRDVVARDADRRRLHSQNARVSASITSTWKWRAASASPDTPDYGTSEVADHTIALMLALTRGVVCFHEHLVRDPVGGFDSAQAPSCALCAGGPSARARPAHGRPGADRGNPRGRHRRRAAKRNRRTPMTRSRSPIATSRQLGSPIASS